MTTKRSDSKSKPGPPTTSLTCALTRVLAVMNSSKPTLRPPYSRAYYDQKRTAGISPQAAYETWLETPGRQSDLTHGSRRG